MDQRRQRNQGAAVVRGLLLLFVSISASLPAAAANYLVVVLDDVGVDKIGAYEESPRPARTPTIDALAANGVLFRNAWVTPACTPTRAALLTGRRGELTGLGRGASSLRGLDADERTIADVLHAENYATAAIGKWHLDRSPMHPLTVGFDTHRGSRANVGKRGYFGWRKFVDGRDLGVQDKYATVDSADEAILWIKEQWRPWFVWLAFNSPHLPLHQPPASLHSYGDLGKASTATIYNAMLEAVDTELARVLDVVGPDTTVIVIGDNGTYEFAIEPPFDRRHGKLTLYESGVNVPWIVAGPDVPIANRGSESASLVQATDLFATIAELAGSDATAEDSVSFAAQLADAATPGRSWLYTSWFDSNGGPPDPSSYRRAARDSRFKLIRGPGARRSLFDLASDPHEQTDLMLEPLTREARRALAELSAVIDGQEWRAKAEEVAEPRSWLPAVAIGLVAAGMLAAGALWRRAGRPVHR